jgi:hypothetical protein
VEIWRESFGRCNNDSWEEWTKKEALQCDEDGRYMEGWNEPEQDLAYYGNNDVDLEVPLARMFFNPIAIMPGQQASRQALV